MASAVRMPVFVDAVSTAAGTPEWTREKLEKNSLPLKMPFASNLRNLFDDTKTSLPLRNLTASWLLAMPSEIVHLIADKLDASKYALTALASTCRGLHAILRSHTTLRRAVEQRIHAYLTWCIERAFHDLTSMYEPQGIINNMIARYGIKVHIFNEWPVGSHIGSSKVSLTLKAPRTNELVEDLLGWSQSWKCLNPVVVGLLKSGDDHMFNAMDTFMMQKYPYSDPVPSIWLCRQTFHVKLQFGPYEFSADSETNQLILSRQNRHGDDWDDD